MSVTDLYPEDLVFEHEATEATGVPGPVIRKWASRGKVRRFEGRRSEYSGQGHEYKTMYALPDIEARAATYKPTPQRSPKAAPSSLRVGRRGEGPRSAPRSAPMSARSVGAGRTHTSG